MNIIAKHIPKRINNPQQAMPAIEGIILHYIGNPGTSARANATYLNNVNEQKSVNYIVDDNEIIELIPPPYKSYGTSNGRYNNSYIQIEMCHPDSSGKITDATLERTVWLCKYLINKYPSLKNIIRHYDATGKKCPLYYVNNPDEWKQLQSRILTKEESLMNLEQAISKLVEKGVINSPDYWIMACKYVNNLEALIIKFAKAI